MTRIAQLYTEGRSSKRVAADRGATLRDAVRRPINVVIEDLSATGFGMSAVEDLRVGSIFQLRLAGLTTRDVRVVRRFGLNYGCEFAPRLTERELEHALNTGSVVDAPFAQEGAQQWVGTRSEGLRVDRLSRLVRISILLGTALVLWAAIIGAVVSFN